MKLFIMSCPQQPEGKLFECDYEVNGNSEIEKANKKTRFPIIPVIYAYAQQDETIKVILIKSTYKTTEHNKILLETELQKAEQDIGIKVELKVIDTEHKETIDVQLQLFSNLIDCINDNDELYVCMTYGTKPTPILQMMAVNYAYRIKNNTKIGAIVYGQRDFETNTNMLFDVKTLFFMDEVINNVSKLNLKNPTDVIKEAISIEN